MKLDKHFFNLEKTSKNANDLREFVAQKRQVFTELLELRWNASYTTDEMRSRLKNEKSIVEEQLRIAFERNDLAVTFLTDTPYARAFAEQYAPTHDNYEVIKDAANRLYRLEEIYKELSR